MDAQVDMDTEQILPSDGTPKPSMFCLNHK
jgi:hypothetical protein